MFVATLIGDGLVREQVDQAWSVLAHVAGVHPDWNWRWLDEGQAADLFFARDSGDNAIADAIREEVPGADVVVQRVAHRAKRLLVADMDSTMIEVECIDELADYAGVKAEVAGVTEAAMRGELDFAAALDARVALLAGLPVDAIAACLAERVRETPGARTLIATMRARGCRTVLVSGGFTAFGEPVGHMLGFGRVVANVLEIADGRLTGRVLPPIVTAQTKLAVLEAEAASLGLAASDTLAVGDGANDLPMVRAAGLGVAFRAKPVVAAAAAARIDRGDLSALLYAQGIARRDWVAG